MFLEYSNIIKRNAIIIKKILKLLRKIEIIEKYKRIGWQ